MLTDNKSIAPFRIVARVIALSLLLVTVLASVQRASAQNSVVGYVLDTFAPYIVNTGRCGISSLYTSSSALSRSKFSPPYTGAIWWQRTGVYNTPNYMTVRVAYAGYAAKKVKQGNSWTVIWAAELNNVSCYVRRIQPA